MAWTTPATWVAGAILEAAQLNTQLRDNLNTIYASRRLAYQERTTTYTINQSTLGSAADIFSSDLTFTADGSSAYRIEWYFPYWETGTATAPRLHLVDGAGNDVTWLGVSLSGIPGVAQGSYYVTPTAGSQSYNLRGTNGGANTSIIGAGAGTAGGYAKGQMAIFGPNTFA